MFLNFYLWSYSKHYYYQKVRNFSTFMEKH